MLDDAMARDDFIPCAVCGQAVPSRWHMDQHLEMLKPLCGMNAECKVCHKPHIEHRALRQHLNFCRLKGTDAAEQKTVASLAAAAAQTEADRVAAAAAALAIA